MKALILGSLLAALMLTNAASAATINQRQATQSARISAGIASGDLTRHEAQRLRAQQIHIHRVERVCRADGVLGPAERADLNRRLNRASGAIAAERSDWTRRY